jgi:putative FmdB family regulatory protein
MPLYEYECENCGKRFEQIQKFSDPPVESCPKCGGGPVRKLISPPAIQFKGSGWYITDYARKDGGSKTSEEAAAPAKSETAPAGGSAASETKAQSKTESKSESKSESKPTTP